MSKQLPNEEAPTTTTEQLLVKVTDGDVLVRQFTVQHTTTVHPPRTITVQVSHSTLETFYRETFYRSKGTV